MSMARLFPLLPFRADETHWSWAARMAAFHIRGPIGTFLRDLGLDPFVLSIGDPDEVARLCATAGQDPGPVLRNTLMRNTCRSWRLGEEILIDSLRPQQDLHFCPACLAEDDAAAKAAGQDIAIHRRERLIWRLKPIRSCPTHRLPLIHRDRPDHMVGKGVFAGSVPETAAMLRDLAGCAKSCPASPLQTYIADRLVGIHGPAWLDSLPLEQSIRVTDLLGTAMEFGPYAAFDDLSVQDQMLQPLVAGSTPPKGWRESAAHCRSFRPGLTPRRCRGGAANGMPSARCWMNSTIPHRAARSAESSMSISRARRNPDPL